MAFHLEGYNTEKEIVAGNENKINEQNAQKLSELDIFEKAEMGKNGVNTSNELEELAGKNEALRREIEEHERLQQKLEAIKNNTTLQNVVTPNQEERIPVEKEVLKLEDVPTEKQQETVKQSENIQKQPNASDELKETASDIVETAFEVFDDIGSTLQQFSGTTSKIKQIAYAAWSVKQDNEVMRKFKKAPKVTHGDYTFKVLLDKKEIMLYSYQGPDTVLKMPSVIKDMKITAINPEFLLFRAPKALINAVTGDTIGKDLDAIKQCMICVEQLRLPNHIKYLPSGLFAHCSSLDVVVVPKDVLGVSYMFLDGSKVKRLVFEGKCPSGLKQATIPCFTKISCRREFVESFQGLENLSVM